MENLKRILLFHIHLLMVMCRESLIVENTGRLSRVCLVLIESSKSILSQIPMQKEHRSGKITGRNIKRVDARMLNAHELDEFESYLNDDELKQIEDSSISTGKVTMQYQDFGGFLTAPWFAFREPGAQVIPMFILILLLMLVLV